MANKENNNQTLTITLVKGLARIKPQHRKTIESLGLKKIGDIVERPNNPAVLGMINQINYLISVK